MGRYDDLLQRQREELARLEAREVAALLEVLEDARLRLAAELARGDELAATPYTLQMLRMNQAFVVRAMEDMGRKVEATLDLGATRASRMGVEDLENLLRAMEPEFLDAGNRLPVGALRRLTESGGLLLHKHSARRYTADIISAIQRELAVGLATGRSVAEVAQRVTGAAGSTLAGVRGRGELIVRMETMRAFDAGHQAAMEEAEALLDIEDDDDPLLARADEYIDARNHPFSRALDGKTRRVKESWEVPLADVLAAAEAMGVTPTGILWPLVGSNYIGNQYPAHFHDRGRQVAWRASWADDT